MPIPKWKWEGNFIDIMVGLPKTLDKFDSILMIVDELTKFAHFIQVQVTYNVEKFAKIYLLEIVQLHGVLVFIIFYRGTQFTYNSWTTLKVELCYTPEVPKSRTDLENSERTKVKKILISWTLLRTVEASTSCRSYRKTRLQNPKFSLTFKGTFNLRMIYRP